MTGLESLDLGVLMICTELGDLKTTELMEVDEQEMEDDELRALSILEPDTWFVRSGALTGYMSSLVPLKDADGSKSGLYLMSLLSSYIGFVASSIVGLLLLAPDRPDLVPLHDWKLLKMQMARPMRQPMRRRPIRTASERMRVRWLGLTVFSQFWSLSTRPAIRSSSIGTGTIAVPFSVAMATEAVVELLKMSSDGGVSGVTDSGLVVVLNSEVVVLPLDPTSPTGCPLTINDSY